MEALGAAGSIVGIVGFGLQIAGTLQTYAEASLEADDRIRDIANDISATASALQRFQAVIVHDEKLSESRVFSVEGLKAVNKISTQCDVMFKRVVQLLNKAGNPGSQLSNAERAKDLKLSTLDHLKWPWLEPKI
jgi:DNA-binding FrmR family transcriptional regulator